MEKINELRMSLVILLVGIFFISGCFFEKNYEVTFKTNGGSKIASLELKAGAKIDEVEEPVKKGYKFIGWYLDGEKYDFDSKVNEDITLVAKWEKEEIEYIEEEETTTSTEITTKRKKNTSKKKTISKVTMKENATEILRETTKKNITSTTTTTTTISTTSTTSTSTSTPITVQVTTSAEVTTRPVIEPTTTPLVPNPDVPEEPSVVMADFKIEKIENIDNLGTEEVEDDVVTYDVTIEVVNDKNESNVELNIDSLDYESLMNSDRKNWVFYSNNDFTFENIYDESLTEISKFTLKGDSKVINSLTLYDGNKYFIFDYDEFLNKWYIKYPTVQVSYGLDVKYYNNIYTALGNAKDDYMITLLSDLSIDQSLIIDKFVIIDFNSKNVESVAEQFIIIKDLNNGEKDLTIKNLNAKVKSFMYFETNVVAKSVVLEKSVITYDGIFKNDTENILINLVDTSFSGIL